MVPLISVRITAPQPEFSSHIQSEMKVDKERADAWYQAISNYLEEQAEQSDAETPWSLVSALCRVLGDALEAVDGTQEQKIEAVARLTAMEMGVEEQFLLLKDPVGPLN